MKILIFTGIFEPEIGGPATYASRLAQELIAVGCQVRVVCYARQKSYPGDNDYTFVLERIKRVNPIVDRLKMFVRSWQLLANHNSVYLLDYLAVGLPVSLAARLRRKKYLVRVGGDYLWEKYMRRTDRPVTLRSFYEKKLYYRQPLKYLLIRFVLSGATKIIYNNDGLGDIYRQAFGLPSEQSAVIFNPTPPRQGDFAGNPESREIIFAGRLIPLKNLQNFIMVFSELTSRDFHFSIIGEGPQHSELEEFIGRHFLREQIKIEQPLSKERLRERLQNCYLLVLPSYSDISPNLISECLSRGVPFVVTRETFLPYRQDLPLVLNPEDIEQMKKVMIYLSEPDNYRLYLEQLANIKWHFSWSECRDQHLKIFQSEL